MNITAGIVVYVVAWWMVFFMMLPIGVEAQNEGDGDVVAGTPPSAPKNPNLLKKALYASIAAAIILALVYWAIETKAISLK